MSASRAAQAGEIEPVAAGRVALVLGLATALLHALTAPSGLFWLDAGDFAAASCELGVAHAPGFPLYVLLGKLFCLVPIGSGGFRVALLSAALAGALTTVLALLFYGLLPARRGAGSVAALATSVLVLWTGGVAGLAGHTPDVYALHVTLALMATYQCLRSTPSAPLGHWLGLGFLVGLGLSNHAEFRLFAPVLLLAAAWRGWPQGPKAAGRLLGRLAATLVAAMAGLLPYLYLPLAARRMPYHAWGEPDAWPRFWDHVTGRTIRLAFEDEMLSTSGGRLLHAAERFASQAWSGLGALLLLAVVGIGVLWPSRRGRICLALLLGILLIDLGYAVALNPMGLRDQQNGLTAFAILALLGAIGLARVLATLLSPAHQPAPRRALRLALSLALVLAVAADALRRAPWDELLLTRSWGAEDLGYETLLQGPEGALVLTGTEAQAAARVYLVAVGALRPDLQVLHRPELSDSRLLWRRHSEGPFPLAPREEATRWLTWGPGASTATYLARLDLVTEYARAAGRTVLWGPGAADETRGRWDLLWPGFPMYELRASAGMGPLPSPPEIVPTDARAPSDPWGRRWLAEYHNFLGTLYVHRGEEPAAAWAYQQAHGLWPDWSAPLVNRAVLAARAGDLPEALALATQAVDIDSLNATAWLNLARYHCLLGNASAAQEAVEHGRDVRPDHPSLEAVQTFIAHCPPPP